MHSKLKHWMVSMWMAYLMVAISVRLLLQSGEDASPVPPEKTDSTPKPWSEPDLRLMAKTSEDSLQSVSEGIVDLARTERDSTVLA